MFDPDNDENDIGKEIEKAEALKEYEEQKAENDRHTCTSRCGNDIDCFYVEVFPSFEEWLKEQ